MSDARSYNHNNDRITAFSENIKLVYNQNYHYGAVTPGEVLEKQDEKQKALARLIERNRAELAALHPEAGAILEKLAGNQTELRDYEARLVFRSGFRLGMQLDAEALTNQAELFEE